MNHTNTPSKASAQELPPVQPKQFLVAMLAYLCMTHLYGFLLYPLGRDYMLLAGNVALPAWGNALLQGQMTLFGAFFPGYYLLNITLLYGCMVCIFFLTRFLVRGPWWLGSLAAVLTMAHPLKNEAVLHATGALDLLPAFFTLLVLTLYGASLYYRRRFWRWAAFAAYLPTLFLTPSALLLPGMLWLLGYLAPESRASQHKTWLAAYGVGVLFALFWWHSAWADWEWALGQRWGSLVLTLYPIGLLPETVARAEAYPILGVLAWLLLAGALLGLCYKTGSRALGLALLCALVLRLAPLDRHLDWVHLVGGGNMLPTIALVAVAFSACCHAVMRHPKWRRPVVVSTTLLCVALIVLQLSSIHHWRMAGMWVRTLQSAVAEEQASGPAFGPFFLFPDLQYYRGAPYQPAEGLRYDTPFSTATPFEAILPLHAATYSEIEYHVNTAEAGRLRLELMLDAPLEHFIPAYYALDGYVLAVSETHPVSITHYADYLYEIVVMEGAQPFPENRVALPQEWYALEASD